MDRYSVNDIPRIPVNIQWMCIFLMLLISSLTVAAQTTADPEEVEERINSIKMSNNYFVAEAMGQSIGATARKCFYKLVVDINKYRAERKLRSLDTLSVTKETKLEYIKMGNSHRIFAYIDRKFAEQKDPMDHSGIFSVDRNKEQVKIIDSGVKIQTVDVPQVIERLSKADSYTTAEWILSNAKNTGRITDYKKYKMADNPNDCYMLVVSKEMKVMGVLTPLENNTRKDVSTGQTVDMKQYAGCAIICIKI